MVTRIIKSVKNNEKIDILHKKLSFPLRIFSVNLTESAGNCGFTDKMFCVVIYELLGSRFFRSTFSDYPFL